MPAKKLSTAQLRIGIAGWTYAPWRGVFYPKGLAHHRELHHASRMINSVEINGTFYSLQRPSSFAAWYDATPADFLFAVKGSRFITHILRLKNAETALPNFLASGLLGLKEKLGPMLWQLPPNFSFDAEKLDRFFSSLPKDTAAAAQMAQKHDQRLEGRALTETDANRPLRHAIEIRHESFQNAEFIDLLRKHNVALVFADTAGRWPFGEDVTADFVYLRLHGDEELYTSGYTPEALDRWAARIAKWKTGGEPADAVHWSNKPAPKSAARDVFVYFDNDVKVKAPFDAMALAHRLGETAQGESQRAQSAPTSPRLTKKALAERVRSHWPATKPKPKAKNAGRRPKKSPKAP
jgi:uncharacterized protein YecE (DUF72 family)